MSVALVTHLNFTGQAREALDFYAQVFGGRAEVRTYADFGMPAEATGADRVVWGLMTGDGGVALMAYDIPGATPGDAVRDVRRENGLTLTDQPFFVALSGSTLEEVSAYWARLSVGATVVEPLAASAFSAGFGMLTDRYGVTWAITVA